ncbi:hypothetical protein GCM10023208_34130 [Erythrobacter westpacificensis]|uniref:Uncharacterized protein n=1 Tax=Erythrobacter westpacificensis TaxID=1055231 RepID=A0ABP9KPG8_9SPHN
MRAKGPHEWWQETTDRIIDETEFYMPAGARYRRLSGFAHLLSLSNQRPAFRQYLPPRIGQ